MMYAIKPNGIGNPVGFRSIRAGWPLAEGETFITSEDPAGKVLAEDQQSLRDRSDAEVLAEAKADKRAALAAKRYAAETGGITVNNIQIATDRHTQSVLTGARILAKEDPAYRVNWKTTAGFVTLDSAAIIAAADAVAAHVQSCFDREKTISEQIDAAADVDTLRAIDIDGGW